MVDFNDDYISMEKEDISDFSTLLDKEPEKKKRKISSKAKNIIYIVTLLTITFITLFISLSQDFNSIVEAFRGANWLKMVAIFGLVLLAYFIESLIYLAFVRLYTRRYHLHQAFAVSLVGAFYNVVTPGVSGGQIMQVYTLKKQGVAASNGASIMIMSFIVYQISFVILSIIAVSVSWNLILQVGSINIFDFSIPIIPFTFIGFGLNILVTVSVLLMSISHRFHNFVLVHIINLLAKIKIIKDPETSRETLRIQIENFKIELKRLMSNIPVFVLIFLMHTLILIIKFSIPFFLGLALNGFGETSLGQADTLSFFRSVFLSCYHQMTTSIIPIPGGAGVSEYLFNRVFSNYYVSSQVTTAAQITWRFYTFYLVLILSGIFVATYRSAPKEKIEKASRHTFVALQLETYEQRKASSDTLYQTSQLSISQIQRMLQPKRKRKDEKEVFIDEKLFKEEETTFDKEEMKEEIKPPEEKKRREKRSFKDDDDDLDYFDTLNI